MVEIWENQGLAIFLNGYLIVINPDDYSELVRDSYFRGDISIPIFATAFGDIITIMIKNFTHFLNFIDSNHITKHFDLPLYHEAIEKYGSLDYDQCFGFVPLLALGGFKDVEHLDKVKMYEHILLITALVGKIE